MEGSLVRACRLRACVAAQTAPLPPAGATVYTCMLNPRGGTESDLTVSRLAPGPAASPLAPAFEGESPPGPGGPALGGGGRPRAERRSVPCARQAACAR